MAETSTAPQRTVASAEARATLQVRSRRFGTFDVPQDSIITLPQGMVGFPDVRRYVVLDHRPGSPFKWMLAIDNPDLAFAVANPYELVQGYEAPLPLAARLLGVEPADVALFVLVTIPPDPTRMTVNLMAPVAVDLRTRIGRQIILDDPRCPPSHPVMIQPAAAAR
jgi:flagellar assembly factor FliW